MAKRTGSSGNDTIITGAEDDTVWANGGDVFGADAGNDTIYTGDGNDTGGGGSGNDEIYFAAGDDLLAGQEGEDTIFGGDGNDWIGGEADNDLLFGGVGNDTMAGGADGDAFIISDGKGHDLVTDFSIAQDIVAFDMAEITRFRDAQTRMSQDGADTVITFDNGDTVRLLNVSKDDLTPSNVQSVDGPICPCSGSLVETARGPVAVENIDVGDLVLTMDGVASPVRAVVRAKLRFRDREDRAKPVLIGAGALGANLPTADLRVSPQHRILMRDESSDAEYLVPAVKLLNRKGIRRMRGVRTVHYYNILLDGHSVLGTAGLAVEALLVTKRSIDRLPIAARRYWQSRLPMQPTRPIRRSAAGLVGAAFVAESGHRGMSGSA